jgi:hypothetical protein
MRRGENRRFRDALRKLACDKPALSIFTYIATRTRLGLFSSIMLRPLGSALMRCSDVVGNQSSTARYGLVRNRRLAAKTGLEESWGAEVSRKQPR